MSFLRLKRTLNEAINTGASSAVDYSLANYSQIVLNPFETYLQYSDVVGGADFDGNYTVHVCKCDGTELLDITEKVAILEMIVSGVTQFAFEIAPIQTVFYIPVILKFKHGISDLTLYSNRFTINTDINTTRIDYLDYSRPVNFYQSIRLNMYFDREDAESEITEYTQINGSKVSGRAIVTNLQHFIFEYLDGFTFRNINNMLITPIVYFNGLRVTNKQILQSDKRASDANWWEQEIEVPINYDDTFSDIPQLWGVFAIVDFLPKNTNTVASVGDLIEVIFNRDVEPNPTAEIRLYKDGDLIETYITFGITNNIVDVPLDTLTNGEYRVEIQGFDSTFGEILPLFFWNFTVQSGEYDGTEYSNEFLID